MNWFAEELRKERAVKGISLNEIALTTRINIHFLEALEQGNFEALPQTYVRAFIKEYAMSVGLNPFETLQRYDLYLGKKLEPSPEPMKQGKEKEPAGVSTIPKSTRILAFVIVGIVICFIGIYFFLRPSDLQPVRQIAFDDVVKETEKGAIPQPTAHPPAPVPQGIPRIVSDSLHLSSTTTDTVWLSIIIDGKRTEEFLFPPKTKYSWIAKEKFSITLGNAGGIHFTLNNKALEPLGKPRAVVRNVVISRENLQRQNSNAP